MLQHHSKSVANVRDIPYCAPRRYMSNYKTMRVCERPRICTPFKLTYHFYSKAHASLQSMWCVDLRAYTTGERSAFCMYWQLRRRYRRSEFERTVSRHTSTSVEFHRLFISFRCGALQSDDQFAQNKCLHLTLHPIRALMFYVDSCSCKLDSNSEALVLTLKLDFKLAQMN